MRSIYKSSLFPTILLLILPSFVSANMARELAKEAYHQMEENVFDREEISIAVDKLNRAAKSNRKEPWIFLAGSLLELINGYKIGDWYRTKSFSEAGVENAFSMAKEALKLSGNESQVFAHLARIHIIKGEYTAAWDLLNTANRISPQDFYPWYFRGIIAEKKRNGPKAKEYLTKARSYAEFRYQEMLVNIHLRKVAKFEGDTLKQEELLKRNIAEYPDDPHIHGNYAAFLMKHERYSEAIEYWRMAIARGSYRRAEEQLKKSIQLEAQQKGQ